MRQEENKINRLIIGGARSGKSRYAQEMARKSGKAVLFVATAEAADDEMRQRIEEHKKNRPPEWKTLEATRNIGEEILANAGGAGVVIVDCITLLVNNIFSRYTDPDGELTDIPALEKEIESEINGLIGCMKSLDAGFIVVTNEVGMDLVPANRMGRIYRDLLGRANQRLAEQSDEAYLMVAGLPLLIKSSGHA